jgi:regulatory protein
VDALRQKAVKLLARREHTRAELAAKLASHGTPDDIAIVLDQLQQSGLLSDRRYAEGFLRSRGARFGAASLRHRLRSKGVSADTVEASLADADLPLELERARDVWAKKFGVPPGDPREWARQARFLQSRGFSGDVIRRLLKDPAQ